MMVYGGYIYSSLGLNQQWIDCSRQQWDYNQQQRYYERDGDYSWANMESNQQQWRYHGAMEYFYSNIMECAG
jgi:hypothetical protein